MRTPAWPALGLALLAALAAAPSACAYSVSVQRAVTYGRGEVTLPARGTAPLLMDLYRPRGVRSPVPAVIVVHGGGFVSGTRSDEGIARAASALASRGILAASIDYRLEGQGPLPSRRLARLATAMEGARLRPAYPDPASVAAATQDALTAIAYLRKNASLLGIRPTRLGLMGSSAGAVTVDNVAYVAPNFGIDVPKIRFVASLWGGLIVPAPGGGPAVTNLRRSGAPLFLVHGTADKTVPVALSDAMRARAVEKRVAVEYHRLAGRGHGWPGSGIFTERTSGGESIFDRMIAYALRRLAPKGR